MSPVLYHGLMGLGLAVLLGLELRSRGFRESSFGARARASVRRNWSFLVAAILTATLLKEISGVLPRVVPAWVKWDHHVVLNVLGCFLVAELFGWCLHWIKHKNGYLWRFHFQHHRETRYDIWLVTHTHGLEVLIAGTLSGVLLTFLGFSAFSVQVYFLFYSLANTYQHSTFDHSLGLLDRVIVNPAYHRLHHAVGSTTNYGNTLTLWDVVFRTATWPASRRAPAVEIGIGDGPEPFGFVEEMTWFLHRDPTAKMTRDATSPRLVRTVPRGVR